MKIINVTGKSPLVPACPSHPGVALIPEERLAPGGNKVAGFWRCPKDDKVYQILPDGAPSPFE